MEESGNHSRLLAILCVHEPCCYSIRMIHFVYEAEVMAKGKLKSLIFDALVRLRSELLDTRNDICVLDL